MVRYYDGVEVRPDAEVDEQRAAGLTTYVRAFFDDGDRLERAELHDEGRILRVDYPADELERAHREHRGRYGADVPFYVYESLRSGGDWEWECVRTYAGDGRPTGSKLVLSDADGQPWMEVERDADGHRRAVTKYDWESTDDLRYVFEYTSAGEGPLVTDLDEGGWSVRFDDLRHELVDVDFFAGADALPRALAGTQPPDCPPDG